MSEEEFEVKGPHEHAIEHGAESGEKFASHVAVLTAVLSTIGALFSFQGGTSQNEAMMILLTSMAPQEVLFVVSPAIYKWATLCYCALVLLRSQPSVL